MKAAPELQGHYVYADYVFSEFRALEYDAMKRRVVANWPPSGFARPVADHAQLPALHGEHLGRHQDGGGVSGDAMTS